MVISGSWAHINTLVSPHVLTISSLAHLCVEISPVWSSYLLSFLFRLTDSHSSYHNAHTWRKLIYMGT